jgi:hypothetical protein
VIRVSPRHTILRRLIEVNGLVSQFDQTDVVAFAPTDDQLQPLLNAGLVERSCRTRRTLEHHLVTTGSLDAGRLPTLNGNINNAGSEEK